MAAFIWIVGLIVAFSLDVFLVRRIFSGYTKHAFRAVLFAILTAPLVVGPEGEFLVSFPCGIWFVCNEPRTLPYLVVGYGSLGFWFMAALVFLFSILFEKFYRKRNKTEKERIKAAEEFHASLRKPGSGLMFMNVRGRQHPKKKQKPNVSSPEKPTKKPEKD